MDGKNGIVISTSSSTRVLHGSSKRRETSFRLFFSFNRPPLKASSSSRNPREASQSFIAFSVFVPGQVNGSVPFRLVQIKNARSHKTCPIHGDLWTHSAGRLSRGLFEKEKASSLEIHNTAPARLSNISNRFRKRGLDNGAGSFVGIHEHVPRGERVNGSPSKEKV